MTADVVRQQAGDLSARSFGIPKRNQNAAPVTQQLLGVPIGCRYNRLSQPETVGERARCHLGFIEIGGRIDVAHRNEVQQCGQSYELVEEDDMVLDAKVMHTLRQTVAIGLALMPHKVWMGRAENDIKGIRTGIDDFWHGIKHGLDALVRRQEAKRKNDRLSAISKFRFGVMRFDEREVRYSVPYNLNLTS